MMISRRFRNVVMILLLLNIKMCSWRLVYMIAFFSAIMTVLTHKMSFIETILSTLGYKALMRIIVSIIWLLILSDLVPLSLTTFTSASSIIIKGF
jgi:hypothetical protein